MKGGYGRRQFIVGWIKPELREDGGSDAYLKNGLTKPSDEKLERLLNQKSRPEIASMYGINCGTLRKWLQKAGLHKFRKSIFDKRSLRKKMIKNLLEKSRKSLDELRYDDFARIKQENGNSYRSLLNWYLSHYGCEFSKAKEYIVKDITYSR